MSVDSREQHSEHDPSPSVSDDEELLGAMNRFAERNQSRAPSVSGTVAAAVFAALRGQALTALHELGLPTFGQSEQERYRVAADAFRSVAAESLPDADQTTIDDWAEQFAVEFAEHAALAVETLAGEHVHDKRNGDQR